MENAALVVHDSEMHLLANGSHQAHGTELATCSTAHGPVLGFLSLEVRVCLPRRPLPATEICNHLQQIGHSGTDVSCKHNKTQYLTAINVWT